MLQTRVMPCLLLRNTALVKTVRFESPAYVGDPINTVRIYNEKEVDELIFLDILAGPLGRKPQLDLLAEIAGECFMPFTYGGGVRSLEDIRDLFAIGAEKVAIDTEAYRNPRLVQAASERFGCQAIVVAVDVRTTRSGGYEVCIDGGRERTGLDPVAYVERMEQLGAGEVLLNSIDRDGTMAGYDLALVRAVSAATGIPVIACGGAGKLEDFAAAVKHGAAAVATGSMVVYQGANRAVLVNFPAKRDLKRALG